MMYSKAKLKRNGNKASPCFRQYQFSIVSVPYVLHIEQCRCVQTLSCLITYSFFARMGHPDVRWSIVLLYSLHSRHLPSISSYRIFLLK
jgi:hypothetical protein